MKRRNNIWFALLFLPFLSFSQLTVVSTPTSNPSTPNTLAQTIAGNGVSVSNATMMCSDTAAGTFSYVGGNLGISSGILLTSGSASQVANPGTYFVTYSDPFFTTYNDPDLTTIEPLATNDVCILEFDFIPLCNSMSMTFVFGSEEYPNFVGSFNDGFGIFLTGPNPGGGNYNSLNIGTLPNTTPVSINNVNAGMNAAYFHDNYTTPNNDIAYDGYTIPVTSVTAVKPCSTYHMKIAISDAGDWSYDSGVFIGNNAVSCTNAPTVTVATTPSNCSGNTGTATASVTNYTGTTTYSWSPGGQTTASITGLSAGSYTCQVGLSLGCGNITQTVVATVTQNGSTLALSTNTVNPLCNGGTNGSATVNIVGGTGPYTTSWSSTPVQSTTTATNLAAGTYTVTVQDNAGCVQTAAAILTNPASIVGTTTTTPSTCSAANGTATANVISGGVAPYAYIWSTTPVQNAQTAIGLVAGTYTVLISDVNSCTFTTTATVALQNGGWSLTANTTTNVACFGGSNGAMSVTINTPGANVFTYVWNTSPVQNTATASGVPVGNYTCAVSDANGCTQATTFTVTQPTLLTATTSVIPTTCTASIGSSTVTANGGTTPYSYSWNSTPVQTTAVASNLAVGAYVVTVTDVNSCTVTASSTIFTQNNIISIAPVIINSKCGSPTGGVTLNSVSGGTAPYTFSWSSTPVQTTQSLVNVVPGNYNVTIIDVYGCIAMFPEVVGLTTGIPLTTSTTTEHCSDSSGTAIVTASGTPPYLYTWNTNPVQTTKTATGLPSGSYQVVVSDFYGCKDSTSVIVTNKDDILSTNFGTYPAGEINVDDAIIITIGANTGWTLDTAYLSGYGNISAYEHHTFNQYGMYYASYFFTSFYGCKDSVVYPIKVNDYMTLYIPSAFTPNGDGLNDNFKAAGTFIKDFELYIYDRWGTLITKLDNIEKSWNGTIHGKDAMEDTYIYKGRATDVFNKHITLQGQVNLIR